MTLTGSFPWSWWGADSSRSWPLLFLQPASVLGGWDERVEADGTRGGRRGGRPNIYDPPVPPADTVSGAFTLLRYTTCRTAAEADCVSATAVRGIFTGTLSMSRNWSPALWSRHVNSLESFTAHTVLTEIAQGQQDHTWSAQGSFDTLYKQQNTVFIPLHLYSKQSANYSDA